MTASEMGRLRLEFCRDAAVFLSLAGAHLESEPVVSTVVSTMAYRTLSQQRDGVVAPAGDWWLVVTDESGAVVGAAMRTATFSPYPPFLLPMPDEAAVGLARALHERGEEVRAINGALPVVRICADETVRLRGGSVEVAQHTRLHELRRLVPPPVVPGHLRLVREDELQLAGQWFAAFMSDADEQAGRARGTSPHEMPDAAELLRRIRSGQLWFWVDGPGRPVHLTAATPPAMGVARLGPVYTPPAERGRGWASSAVAEVSRRLQADGARVCLFTDQANPTSNKIYAALGYQPVVDMANLVIAD